MKILIVELDGPLQRAIKSLVADLADEILERRTATEALAAYAQHRPDWVVLGTGLGERKGLELVRQLNAVWPDARIVMIAHDEDQELHEAFYKAGGRGIVTKENLIELRRNLRP